MGTSSSCCDPKAGDVPSEVIGAQRLPATGESETFPENPEPSLAVLHKPTGSQLQTVLQNTISFKLHRAIARGIPVNCSLREWGRLWMVSPLVLDQDSKANLWEKSQPMESFDVFFSHTWRTSGGGKFLALLLQYGGPTIFFSWFCTVTLMFTLSASGLLPMPLTYEADLMGFKASCPYAPWAYISGTLALLISMFAFPYCSCGHFSSKCFLDVVSIHQADLELQQLGVYGLGGFLHASKELRVLWSPPYLTRLWCVFELAAFRKANPARPVYIKPLFVERQVFLMIFGGAAITGFYMILRQGQTWALSTIALAITPIAVVVHTSRKSMMEKDQLTKALENFQLEDAECAVETDKTFVRSAIRAWYGSEDAFTAYVRGPLRKELLARSTELQLSYVLLVCLSPCSFTLDTCAAIILGGAPRMAALANFLCNSLGFTFFCLPVSLKAMWFLSSRWASVGSTKMADYLVSLAIFAIFFVLLVTSALIPDIARQSLWTAVVFPSVAFLLAVVVHAQSWRR